MEPKVTKAKVLDSAIELYRKFNRPVHIGDIKRDLGVLGKNTSLREKRGNSASYRIARNLHYLFCEGKLSRSEDTARIENYPASPYSTRKSVTTNVHFYAPPEFANQLLRFRLNGQEIEQKFITRDMVNRVPGKSKKEMVLEFLRTSDRALTTNELLDLINQKYNAYDVSTKRKYYNATTSILRAVLKPLRKDGLKGRKLDNRWIWYFTEEQLKNYKKYYIRKNPVLRLVEDLVKSEKCVPLTRILSELQMSPEDAKYHIKKVAKFVPVKITTATTDRDTKVELEIKEFKRDSFIDWLGIVIPQSSSGFGYETMLVYLDSDWEEELRRQVKKSLSRIHVRAMIGHFYEKLAAKIFNIICTSKELQNSELGEYMIPFVFRDKKVTNVWVTMDSGRRGEFDVLIRGTFNAFNAMTQGKPFLDIVIPIESKYTIIKPEHVTAFDDKIRKVFGDRRNVIPIMIGLSWSQDAMQIAKRFGILTVYFSALDQLVRAMTGKKYRHEHEWKIVEQKMNEGRLSFEELKEQLDKQEYKFLFEEYIEERLHS